MIQRFEFTFELLWKTLLTIVRENGMEFRGVKTVFRDAGQIGLFGEPEIWFSYLEARNLTSHRYDLEIAEKVYKKAKEFSNELKNLLTKLVKSE